VENNPQHGLCLCPCSFITSCKQNVQEWQYLPWNPTNNRSFWQSRCAISTTLKRELALQRHGLKHTERTFSAVLSPKKGMESRYHFFELYWLVQKNHENPASAISKVSTIESQNLDDKGSFFQAWLQRVKDCISNAFASNGTDNV
jgi:hypothetical protein